MNANPDWAVANQRYLMAALGVVRAALERSIARESTDADADDEAAREELAEAAAAMPAPAALQAVCDAFGLSAFERDVLVLCAGVELHAAIGPLCAAGQGDPRHTHPTFSLALAALPDAHWSAITPGAPLRYWRLVEPGAGDAITVSPLRIDERVLHYLAGQQYLDERLHGVVTPLQPTPDLAQSHADLAARIEGAWSAASGSGRGWPAVQLCGADVGGARAVALAVCGRNGLRLHTLPADVVPLGAGDLETLRRVWEREAVLGGCALLVEADQMDAGDSARLASVTRFVERVGGAVLVSSREPLRLSNRPTLRLDVAPPAPSEQRQVWLDLLGPRADEVTGQIDGLVAQFNLSTQSLRAAGAQVSSDLSHVPEGTGTLPDLVWDACRTQARTRLADLAQRVEPAATWDDLVLPRPQREILRDIALQVRERTTVYERWGFAARGARGLGITALFSGPSGTGKTMAAEVLANELRLDLYCIDLSAVVSKYIGETEKNLRHVFDAAEEGGAILLFDEADALFGKRTEVKDSHDRYANIEVSYLLQRMEAYRGLAILTSNLKSGLDAAFMRRLRFVVQFPFPDQVQRAEIWRRVFPSATPAEALDHAKLARLNVAGGNIRTIALNAAFIAAGAEQPVGMAHVLRATSAEYVKLERALTDAEVGGWV
jgi:ATPase family associated with various cellular activities (AAA)